MAKVVQIKIPRLYKWASVDLFRDPNWSARAMST